MTQITVKRIEQLEAFCGPASLVTMLSQHEVCVTQKGVAKAAGKSVKDVKLHGMRIDQLALAVRKLAPHLAVWAKRDAALADLNVLINQHSLACGVEWQEIPCEEEKADCLAEGYNPEEIDNGHYSVITGIDMQDRKLTMQNPSSYQFWRDQVIPFEEFEQRWFDDNHIGEDDPEEAKEWAFDNHVLFVVAPKNTVFPEELGLKKVRVAAVKKPWILKKIRKFSRVLEKIPRSYEVGVISQNPQPLGSDLVES